MVCRKAGPRDSLFGEGVWERLLRAPQWRPPVCAWGRPVVSCPWGRCQRQDRVRTMWALQSRQLDLLWSLLVVRTRQSRRRHPRLTLRVGVCRSGQCWGGGGDGCVAAVGEGWVEVDRCGGAGSLRGVEAGQEGDGRGAEEVGQLGGAEDADGVPIIDEEEDAPRGNDGHEVLRMAEDGRAAAGHAVEVDGPAELVVYTREVRVVLDVTHRCLEEAGRFQGEVFWDFREGLRGVRDGSTGRAFVG